MEHQLQEAERRIANAIKYYTIHDECAGSVYGERWC